MEALDRGDNPSNPCQNVNQDFYTSGDSVLDRVLGSATLPMRTSLDDGCPPQTVNLVKVASSLFDI